MQPSEFEKLTIARLFALISGGKKELKALSYKQVVKMMREEQKIRFGRKID